MLAELQKYIFSKSASHFASVIYHIKFELRKHIGVYFHDMSKMSCYCSCLALKSFHKSLFGTQKYGGANQKE